MCAYSLCPPQLCVLPCGRERARKSAINWWDSRSVCGTFRAEHSPSIRYLADAWCRCVIRRGSPLSWAARYDPNKPKRARSSLSQQQASSSPVPSERCQAPSPSLPRLGSSGRDNASPRSTPARDSPPLVAETVDAIRAAREQVFQAEKGAALQRAQLAEQKLASSLEREATLEAELQRLRSGRRAGATSSRAVMGSRPAIHPLLLDSLERRHIQPVARVTAGDLMSAPLLHQGRQYGRQGSNLPGRAAFQYNPPPLPPIPAARRPDGTAPVATHSASAANSPVISSALAGVLKTRAIRVNLTTPEQAVRVGNIAARAGIESQPISSKQQLEQSVNLTDGTCVVRVRMFSISGIIAHAVWNAVTTSSTHFVSVHISMPPTRRLAQVLRPILFCAQWHITRTGSRSPSPGSRIPDGSTSTWMAAEGFMIDGFSLYEILHEATGIIWDDQLKNLQDMTTQLQTAVVKGAAELKEAQCKHAVELHDAIVKRQQAQRKLISLTSRKPGAMPRWAYERVAERTKRDRWRECDGPLTWWRSIAGVWGGLGPGLGWAGLGWAGLGSQHAVEYELATCGGV